MTLRNLPPIVASAGQAIGDTARWLRNGEYNKIQSFDSGSASVPQGLLLDESNYTGLKGFSGTSSQSGTGRLNQRNEDSEQQLGATQASLEQILPVLLTSILQLMTTLIGQLLGQPLDRSLNESAPKSLVRNEQVLEPRPIKTGTSGLRLQTGTLNGQPFVATPFFVVGETPKGFPFTGSPLTGFETVM